MTNFKRARIKDDIAGQRFGRLVVIGYHGPRRNTSTWLVRCDCGIEKVVERSALKSQQSCGCLRREGASKRFATHGLTRVGQHHPLYAVWNGMIRRCYQKTAMSGRYKDRGIIVCNRWISGGDGKTGFECFLADMGDRPSKYHSIDRINNDGPYSPENCRWATIIEQQRNRSSNRHVIFQGRKMTLTEAIELSGLKEGTVWGRLLLGWSEDRALTTPAIRRGNAQAQ